MVVELKERTFLRGIALQALYEYDLSDHNITDILTNRFDSENVPDDDAKKFVIDLVVGVINNKTTAVRLIPAYGCKVGDNVNFGGLLGEAPVMPVKTVSPAKFIARGGRIPAPIHSLKN